MSGFLPRDLLERYIRGFWGYGELASPVWVVGMEEGGESRGDFEHKLRCFSRSGDAPLQDLREVHSGADLERWFRPGGPLQPTWARFAQFIVALEGGDHADKEVLRAFQQTLLGRRGARHAMIELMPLPARKIGSWPYCEWSDLPTLRSRAAYDATVRPARIAGLRAMLQTHRPTVVLFCGTTYRTDWESVAGAPLAAQQCCGHGVFLAANAGTTFVVAPHPTAFGVTRDLYGELAARAAKSAGWTSVAPG
ncbi:MAG: hypothetical protein U0625_09130 [Phycisphaerales bacterium]